MALLHNPTPTPQGGPQRGPQGHQLGQELGIRGISRARNIRGA